jgi:PAS domain S-box-containing protein
MNFNQEVDQPKILVVPQKDKLVVKNTDREFFDNQSNSICILYFSDHTSTEFIFDLITQQCSLSWHACQSSNVQEISDLASQNQIDLLIIYQDILQADVLTLIKKVAEYANFPILVAVDRESEEIATATFKMGGQDYITIEELQDTKIFRRVVEHTINRYRWTTQNNDLPKCATDEEINHKQAKDLRQDEENFSLLGEHIPIGIFHLDLLGNAIYTNAYLKNLCVSNSKIDSRKNWIEELHPDDRDYLETIGVLESGENLGKSWMDYIHPDDHQKVMQSFEEFIQGVSLFDCEFRLIRSQSDIRWVVGQGITLMQSNGKSMGYVGTIADITDRKKAEENLKQLNIDLEDRVFERTAAIQQINLQLRIGNKIREFHEVERKKVERELYIAHDQLQAVLDAVPGCVAWVSANLTYLGVNKIMAQTFQIDASEFIGKEVGFIESNTKDYVHFVNDFFSGSKVNLSKELVFEINEGEKRFYLLIGQKYSQGESAVFVAIDITERKRAETETQNALEKVKELSDLKSRFIFMVSHEFRTPLTSIFSASELLEHYGNKWPAEKKLYYLKQIQESVQRMNGLLEDVLVIGAGEVDKLKIQLTELNIVDLCHQLIEEIQLSKNNHHIINFQHATQSQAVIIDVKLLRHILSNLLSNAVKYSPKKIPIDFELFGDSQGIVFHITDYGIGIPLEDQKHLFDLFHRASNVGTIGGTGIGLSIVKKSVDALGGNISFQSDTHTGSKFTVSIPIKQTKEEYQW